ncbi:hypothetical protein J3Q64DRAFT_1699249 [Phycomyces blakesleeanus]|uniref:CAF17 C-terminal domain-containing protein n=2 Tax=Phycomyces blakesleeanus TaxID=4837 RepID=A0A167MQK7_PHYB8|nr:hypothetical protein PHYBLDRAFT_187135 [Phycomyces blakesleeanus NRRL 1555(-)]OAD73554.1 hypothetical protein PHYBLDRAFT_187135 [Phycomyces blakesleeanus NRRL 1555(-)]|eukprot:XP_018291594.1 hypothetical protein PHYBLDRAFT_187135 [Phycomyces blakesleeanus NRRL 1555(-)]
MNGLMISKIPSTMRSQVCRRTLSTQVSQQQGNKFCQIPNRGLLELRGPDTVKFLQGLTTNNTRKIASGGEGCYTSFLTPQGRMLYDAFIYPVNGESEKWIIECDERVVGNIAKHLKRYQLRAKVKMQDVTQEYSAWSAWGGDVQKTAAVGCYDPRVPGLGYRAIVPKQTDIKSVLGLDTFEELPAEEYTIRRLLNGVAEGPDDMWPEHALPLESNMDYMHGVDFNKGCYVGQELTIRTHHTGVVRKRMMPVQIYNGDQSVPESLVVDRSAIYPVGLEPQVDIKLADGSSKRSVGKLGSGIHNIGMALMRLEHVKKFENTQSKAFNVAGTDTFVRPFLPTWWPVEEEEEEKE